MHFHLLQFPEFSVHFTLKEDVPYNLQGVHLQGTRNGGRHSRATVPEQRQGSVRGAACLSFHPAAIFPANTARCCPEVETPSELRPIVRPSSANPRVTAPSAGVAKLSAARKEKHCYLAGTGIKRRGGRMRR